MWEKADSELSTYFSQVRKLIHAEQIWPYYDKVVHTILCDQTPRQLLCTMGVTAIFGIVFYPLLALLADIDMQKWASHKKQKYRIMEPDGADAADSSDDADKCF